MFNRRTSLVSSAMLTAFLLGCRTSHLGDLVPFDEFRGRGFHRPMRGGSRKRHLPRRERRAIRKMQRHRRHAAQRRLRTAHT